MSTEIMSLRNIERKIIVEKNSKKEQTKITTFFSLYIQVLKKYVAIAKNITCRT